MTTIKYIGTLGGVAISLPGGGEIVAIRDQPVSVPDEVALELLERESDWAEVA